jgi:malate dehydrogenase (oxaloacetate-decarboxylating)
MTSVQPTRDEQLARAAAASEEALRLHAFYRGKMQTLPKCAIRGFGDFAIWYTPGVAAPCKSIQATPELVYDYTSKGNTIAVVSDGTRVLGLGDIGPEAGLPVMEGKSLLFKYLGGVDAVPICLRTKDADELIRTVELLEPAFGAFNLEDIAQPKCFRVLDELRGRLSVPVWHDDQQGTACCTFAALLNALEVVGKELDDVRIAMVGMGAANVANYRILTANGVDPSAIVACDVGGVLHPGRSDYGSRRAEFHEQWRVCTETNRDGVVDGIQETLRGADVCIAFSASGPNVIDPDWIRDMAPDPIVFACANPVPEIWPWEAKEAGARIVATGRSDFPNQLNNSLVFPGLFRGVLDVRARAITEGMVRAVAEELALIARERALDEESILPKMHEPEVPARLAVAAGLAAQADGVAGLDTPRDELYAQAEQTIRTAREATDALVGAGLVEAPE